ncbi:MAG: hypothetical protein KDK51_06930 [Deltaproteobacteria bacterium]|nr:hypothetical protein [Deltaproteobacteria bacterium]
MKKFGVLFGIVLIGFSALGYAQSSVEMENALAQDESAASVLAAMQNGDTKDEPDFIQAVVNIAMQELSEHAEKHNLSTEDYVTYGQAFQVLLQAVQSEKKQVNKLKPTAKLVRTFKYMILMSITTNTRFATSPYEKRIEQSQNKTSDESLHKYIIKKGTTALNWYDADQEVIKKRCLQLFKSLGIDIPKPKD